MRRLHTVLLLAAIVLVPAGFGVWLWFAPPFFGPKMHLAAAEKALAAHNLIKAHAELDALLAADPDNLRGQYLATVVARRQGRNHDAYEALLKAKDLGLPYLDGLHEFALLEAGSSFLQVHEGLKLVLDEHPDDRECLQALAEGYERVERWPEAEDIYTRWLALEPDRLDLLFKRANARKLTAEILKRPLDSAVADCREVLRRAPEHFHARLLLADCLMGDARMAEAEKELLICKDQRPDHVEPLIGLANCAVDRKDLDQAQSILKTALTLDPISPMVIREQAELHIRRERYDLAVPFCQRWVQLLPRDKQAYFNLALVLNKTGQAEKAKEAERKYQELDKEEEKRSQASRGMK
jgi:tetratricopeptide (TPR) repeat protein